MLSKSRPLCKNCGPLGIKRQTYRDHDTCYACTARIRCEVPTCGEWVQVPWTTCNRHTALLRRVGAEPKHLPQDAAYRSKAPMTAELIDTLDENDMIPIEGFRFSASYASRFHKCHGSANLTEAIAGFQHPERNDNGMKGEGTKRHKIFEVALSSPDTLEKSANLLRGVAEFRGNDRILLLQDKAKFITWWFMNYEKALPPLSIEVLYDNLVNKIMNVDTNGNQDGTY